LKINVRISNENQYSTITRSDGLMIRINECYLIQKQDDNPGGLDNDIFSIERLWIDENDQAHASGFYYLRPSETFHEINRKFYSNEIFRFPSTNDSISIQSILRPCYVLDTGTFCKGRPIPEYTSRLLPTDLFLCEFRVDKLAKTFTRLPKSKHLGMNTKSYCFDNYIEKLSMKRDYQV
jgi:chromatin structure-remodeling complex subunit RSC1/2